MLEQRDGQVYLRDLGSTNGTFINGRRIRDLEVNLRNGDQFQIGPMLATLQIGLPARKPRTRGKPGPRVGGSDAESRPPLCSLRWLRLLAPKSCRWSTTWTPRSRIKFEILEEVLVITPQLPELEDEATLEALRSKLATSV